MPIYLYTCEKCGSETKVSHSMTETMEDCEVCGSSKTLVRVPAIFSNIKRKPKQKEKIGSYIKDFIKDAKKDLKQQKEELRNKND